MDYRNPDYVLSLSVEDDSNNLMWLRGDGGGQGLQSLNFQSVGMSPGIQQRFEPLLFGNENDPYRPISAPALQDARGGEFLKHQFLQYQQPFQIPQESCRIPQSLQQQIVQQPHLQQIISYQPQSVFGNQAKYVPHPQLSQPHNEQQVQQPQTYADSLMLPNNHMPEQHLPIPSQLCQNLFFPDSGSNLSPVQAPNCVQSLLSPSYLEGTSTNINFSRLGQPMMSEQNQQPWEPKFSMSQVTPFGSSSLLPSFPEKDGSAETESCTADSQNHTLFGANIESPSLLSNAVPSSIPNAITNLSTVPYASSCIQNSLYGCLDESSSMLQNADIELQTRTFVKVYKSGSVGRSLDISQFSNYDELREELGKMFGIEGQLKDPFRSGWQLVFVDRENDVLLLGDDPWEQFVNSVWYIKILSPEDVYNIGKQGV